MLPNSLKTLGLQAFKGCYLLESVKFGSDLETIGDMCFYECSLKEIVIPDKVTTIGNAAFYRNNASSVTLGEELITIQGMAFYECQKLESIVIPDKVTTIGATAFYNCAKLTTVVLGRSVATIGELAFQFCPAISSITSLNPEPPVCGSGVVNSFVASATLYVPEEGMEAYLAAEPWKYFTKIYSIGFPERQEEAMARYDEVAAAYSDVHESVQEKIEEIDRIVGDLARCLSEVESMQAQLAELLEASSTYTMTPEELSEFEDQSLRLEIGLDHLSDSISFDKWLIEDWLGDGLRESDEEFLATLAQLKEAIASATTLAELDAAIAELDSMMADIEGAAQELNQISFAEAESNILGYEEEIAQYKAMLVDLSDFLASGIDEILADGDRTIEVVGLDGQRWTMPASELRKLRPGVYVVRVGGLTVKVAL